VINNEREKKELKFISREFEKLEKEIESELEEKLRGWLSEKDSFEVYLERSEREVKIVVTAKFFPERHFLKRMINFQKYLLDYMNENGMEIVDYDVDCFENRMKF